MHLTLIIVNYFGFRALHLAGGNEFCFLINTYLIFGHWLVPKKFSVCPKMMSSLHSGVDEAPPQPPGSDAYGFFVENVAPGVEETLGKYNVVFSSHSLHVV